MATKRRNPVARLLLNCVPATERPHVVREVVQALTPNSGATEITLAVSLLVEHPDDAVRRDLLSRLLGAIESDALNAVEAACEIDVDLGKQLLLLIVDRLYRAAQCLGQKESKTVRVPMDDIVHMEVDAADDDQERHEFTAMVLRSYLSFAKRSSSSTGREETFHKLLSAVLVFLGSSDQEVGQAACALLVSLASSSPHILQPNQTSLWQCVRRLLTAEVEPMYQELGYTIWLRLAASTSVALNVWFDPEYWELIRQGLRDGDAERRKQCLVILRQSITVAIRDETTRSSVISHGNDAQSTDLVEDQFERYCTVFETILLSRYINQVIECENDLALLASSASLVPSEWLYTLLIPALGPKIQDSNRKFLGNWIMRSRFKPNRMRGQGAQQFVAFFRQAFLPWAVQGQLFTASLRKRDGAMRSEHGEQLADYLAHLLTSHTLEDQTSSLLVGSVLELVDGKKSGSFAYAKVYLLEGLARGFEGSECVVFTPSQLEIIVKLASWTNLPEVARDYVLSRCLKLCGESTLRSAEPIKNSAVLEATRRWHDLQQKCIESKEHTRARVPISSWQVEMSNRESLEQRSVEKIEYLCSVLSSKGPPEVSGEVVLTKLQDLWNDVEYLEYPKRLLVPLPSLTFHPTLIRLALSSGELRRIIIDMAQKLQGLSATRLYMLSPLALGMRNSMLSTREVDQVLSVQDFVLRYAEGLPEPTVDLKLEDAVAHLLQSVSPELEYFGYQYYFGDRESFGVAALLDLVSRLGALAPAIPKSFLGHILQRWVKQKTPPPTVSPWKSSLQLQILLLCSEQVIPTLNATEINRLLKDLHYILSIEPLPRYRYLLSWVIVRIYLRCEDAKSQILAELATKDHHTNPKYLASLMKLGVMLAKVEDSDQDFALKLASACIPLAASPKVVIRHEAQWQLPILMDHARDMQWTAISESPALLALDECIRSIELFDNPPLERRIDKLDPVRDHTMANLVEGQWWALDSVESPLCSRADFVKLLASKPALLASTPCIPLGEPIDPTPHAPLLVSSQDRSSANEAEIAPSKAGGSRALQTKGSAYLASDSSDRPTRRNDLIVVASLVENPYNLGGLSRVSEIFGASELHLQNQKVTSSKDFTNVAVSSHLHLPICQLSATAVPAYLAEKRSDGWSVVGIEQTDRSVLLGSKACVLPKKTVLVVGSEREGIPALVLSECDMLVEIPQQGITRSLNVQTAAGIVLYEYARQHRR